MKKRRGERAGRRGQLDPPVAVPPAEPNEPVADAHLVDGQVGAEEVGEQNVKNCSEEHKQVGGEEAGGEIVTGMEMLEVRNPDVEMVTENLHH